MISGLAMRAEMHIVTTHINYNSVCSVLYTVFSEERAEIVTRLGHLHSYFI